jgi:hypothetical protein
LGVLVDNMEFKEECDVCGKEEELVDAVYENKPVKLCSYCKTLPEVVVLQKPSQDQLNRMYHRYTFSSRAKQEIQNRKAASPPANFRGFTIEDLRKIKREKEELEKKSEVPAAGSGIDFKSKDVKIKDLKKDGDLDFI